jgi:DNA-binding response OmpR family regulator
MNNTENGRASVLIAEDDEHISYLLKFMLSREGYETIIARDGREAQAVIDQIEPPDLVLLDIMLPYQNGLQLLAYVRGKPDWNKVPIVMLTAKSQERDITRALDAGANDYVIKPFRPNELAARLRRLLR